MKTTLVNYLMALTLMFSLISCGDDEPTITAITDHLTASKTAYESATKGDWIAITETEYNALAASLRNVNTAGTVDSLFADTDNLSDNGGNFTWSNSNSATMPAGSYLFAFKYRSATTATVANSTVKISTSGRYADLADFGAKLPSHAGDKVHYFVIKDSDTPIASGKTGYLAMYFSQTIKYWYKNNSGLDVDMQYSSGNTTSTPSESGGILLYQGLSTTEKQW